MKCWILRSSCCALLAGVATLASATNAYISLIPETCGNSNGTLTAYLSGSYSDPLSYVWSNGATTQTLTGLSAGTYSVTITEGTGLQYTAGVTFGNEVGLPIGSSSPSFTGMYELLGYTGGACPSTCNGAVSFPMVDLGGTGPFTLSFDVASNYLGTNMYGHPIYGGFCALGMVNYTLTDALGCSGSGTFQVVQIDDLWNPYSASAQGACDGSNVGTITVNAQAPASHYDITLYAGGEPLVGPLELFGGDQYTFEGLSYGAYEVYSVPDWSQCTTVRTVVVDDLGPGCTQLTGTSWFDTDGDCMQDVGEIGIPGSVLLIQPGAEYVLTEGDGSFTFTLPAGNYTLSQTDPYLDPYCPATMPTAFTVSGTPVDIHLANNSTAPLDVRIHANAGNARPGFSHPVHGSVVNSTVQSTGPVTVTCVLDAAVDFVSAVPSPTAVSGNQITWDFADLDYFGTQDLNVVAMVPASTPLGTQLIHAWSVSTTAVDADLANNTDLAQRFVAGSYDPNDKTAFTSTRSSEDLYFIGQDEWVDYTVRFQNTGTAEAFNVIVTDTLPETFDMASFQMGTASHEYALRFKPGRVVEWKFDGINLPDSTSNEPESHGFVSFRIRPVASLLAGMVLENSANIYFDFNEPVITEPSVLVAEFSTSIGQGSTTSPRQLNLLPNPATDLLTVTSDTGIISIRIVTADGREVLRSKLRTSSARVDVNSLMSGAYLLIADLTNGTTARERFIKN